MTSVAKTDDQEIRSAEYSQLIDALDLEVLPKKFLKSRWLDQLNWMEAASRKNQRYYYLFRLVCIVGGVIIPALVSVNAGGTPGALVKLAVVVLSLAVAVSAAIEEFLHFGERWRHYRSAAEFLKSEGWSFFQLSGPYREHQNHADAYPDFAGRVEEALRAEVNLFITKVSKEKQEGEQPPKPKKDHVA